jgi:hypothetical protein
MKPEKVMQPNQILAEGRDAYYFLRSFLASEKIENIQIMDYGGIKDLTDFLRSLSKQDGYDSIRSIIIARDAEMSAVSAIQSVNGSLKKAGVIDSDITAFKISDSKDIKIKVGVMLFPGFDDTGKLCAEGTLEDLCIKLFKFREIVPYADACINDFEEKRSVKFKRPHKNKLHTMLSLTDDYAGMKIGETANAQGFNFKSPYLRPYIDILEKITCLGSAR